MVFASEIAARGATATATLSRKTVAAQADFAYLGGVADCDGYGVNRLPGLTQ
jgi:hypothetical protein